MQIESIQLTNFQKHESFSADFSSGLNLIVGDNWKGKTTVLRAILYALFGSSGVSGIKSSDLLREGAAAFSVKLSFSVGGLSYEVERSDKKAFLRHEGNTLASKQTDVTSKIESLTGKTAKDFLYFNYVEQEDSKQLLKLGGTKISNLMEEVTGVDIIGKIIHKAEDFVSENKFAIAQYAEAKDKAVELGEQEESLKKKIFDEKQALKKFEERDQAVSDAIANWSTHVRGMEAKAAGGERCRTLKAQAEARLEELRGRLNGLQTSDKPVSHEELSAAYSASQDLQQRYDLWQEFVREQTRRQDRIQEAEAALEQLEIVEPAEFSEGELEQAKGEHERKLIEVGQELKQLRLSLNNQICQTCQRPFDEAHVNDTKRKINELEESFQELSSARSSFLEFYNDQKSRREKYKLNESYRQKYAHELNLLRQTTTDFVEEEVRKEDLDEATEKYAVLYKQHFEAIEQETKRQRIEAEIKETNVPACEDYPSFEEIQEARNSLELWRDQKEAYRDEYESLKIDNAKSTSALNQISKQLAQAKEATEKLQPLVEKLHLRKLLIKFLKTNKSKYTEMLWQTLLSYTSEFVTEATGGETTELVRSADGEFLYRENGELRSVRVCSGMQGAILGVSLKLALGAATGSSSDVLLLDEATAGGTEENSLLFTQLLKRYGSQVLLVTHREADTAEADTIISV